MSEFIVDVTEANAQSVLIEESKQRLVMVDFWADWCAPCKSIMPILEKLAVEYGGQLMLARVNADQQGGIAAQFGVRSLPTVVLMKDGQPVDGFMGAQPESAIRELLEKYLPKPWDLLLQQAQALIEDGNDSDAIPLLRQAHEQSKQRADISIALARAYVAINRIPEAEKILATVGLVDQNADYEQVKAQLELKQQAAKSPELTALEQQHQQNPNDLEVAYQLAVQYNQDGHHREALELLYGILQTNSQFNEGAAKKTLLDILTTLGKGDPLAVEFQRKVYTLLY
jgi:putative thioredoxin